MKKKEKRKNSVRYMVLSLALAVIIWIATAYFNGNSAQIKIKRLNVNYIGRTQLAENGLVIVNGNEESNDFSVTVTGKRDILARSFGKWTAEVDVSGISEPGEYDLEGKVTPPNSNLAIKEKNFDTIHVKIEEIVRKEVPVEIWSDEIKGKLINTESDHRTVVVSGAKNEVERVSMALAMLDIEGADVTEQSMMLPLIPADDRREPVPQPGGTLSLDINQVTVICTIYDLTTLPVRAELADAYNPGYYVDAGKTRISPASATVGILPGTDIKSVRAEVKNITEEEMECELIEEEGMYIPESSRTVKVKLSVSKK